MPHSSDVPVPVHAPGSPLAQVTRLCQRIARSDSTVLLTGETGTGKEVFARMIHAASPRSRRMLVPVNCGAIPEALLESELFGYVRGAFTGASAARKGRIAAAEGGTLFLDEVGEMPLPLQVKLLRVLQERSYEPIGSAESVRADIRLVAATNRDLAAEVEAGRFREDLYYRLLVCPVELPPLRARRADVPVLFAHFWERRGETRPVDPGVYAALAAYDWPGNVRELENLAERLSVCVEGSRIRVEDLPDHLRAATIAVRSGASMSAASGRAPDDHGAAERMPPGHAPAVQAKGATGRVPPANGSAAGAFGRTPVAQAPAPGASGMPGAYEPAPAAHELAPGAATQRPTADEGAAFVNELVPGASTRTPTADESAPLANEFGPGASTRTPTADESAAGAAGPMAFASEPPAHVEAFPAGTPAPPAAAGAPEAAAGWRAASDVAVDAPGGEMPAAANDADDPLEAILSLELPLDLPRFIRELEDRLLERALERTNGNKRAAADLLGLQRTTLVEKLRRRARQQAGAARGTSAP